MAVATPAGRYATRIPDGRMVEWGILAAVVLVLMGIFGHYVRVIQGQGERAAVVSTLGSLRTALVIDHVQRAAKAGAADPLGAPPNPFLALQTRPVNYSGEMSAAQAVLAPAGHWVFDPQCVCVGYAPQDPAWHSAASGVAVLWFKVSSGPGPRVLTAQAPYVWQGTELH